MSRSPLLSRLRRVARATAGLPAGPSLDRRSLIRLGLAAATVPAFGCKKEDAVGGRVVVVGAGIAGLHCAWRLAEAGVDVQIYDAADRVGGRMWTGRGLFANGLLCEIGGELIDSNHLAMWELSEEFGIALDDRWALERPGMVRDTWWAEGRAVPEEEIVSEFVEVAPAMAKAFQLAELTDDGYASLDQTSLTDFLNQHCPYDRYPALHVVLDSAYRGEYGLENDQQSCLNLIYLIDAFTPDPFRIFGDSDERWHTHDGNDTFTTALAEAIGADRFTLESELVGVRDREGGGYVLEFADRSGGTFEDEADHVVFALPFSLLRKVRLDCELRQRKRTIIEEIGYGTNAKVMGGFTRRPWWDDANASGSVTADLPFQQTWDSTIGQDGPGGVLTNFLGGNQGVASGEGTEVAWFESLLPDLDRVWPGMTEAFDGTAVRMHWPSFKWSQGSYTCYKPGQWAFWSQEGRRDGNLHFCGEHTSLDFQGWMEGAAETGALVAAEILDDRGLARSARHQRIVAAKTLFPQACYHGDLLPDRMRPLARRRDAVRRLRALRP